MKFDRFAIRIGLIILLAACFTPAFSQYQISGPNTTVPGGQLIYYFDLINNDTGTFSIKNVGPSLVFLHVQVINEDCEELFNFLTSLEPNCARSWDLRKFVLNKMQGSADLINNRGMIFVTPTYSTIGYAALPYNHLVGSIVIANSKTRTSYGMNAIARPAIDSTGNLLPDSNTPLNGTTSRFQIIRPKMLHLDHFFPLQVLTDSRLAIVAFVDVYTSSNYYVTSPSGIGSFHMMGGTEDCAKLSIPALDYFCMLDVQLKNILGGTIAYYNQSSGSLEMTPMSEFDTNENLFGFFFESLGPYASARPLWVVPDDGPVGGKK